MKGDTEHSTVQGSKDKEIDLIRKSSKEKQKKRWSKEEILILLLKNLSHQENLGSSQVG